MAKRRPYQHGNLVGIPYDANRKTICTAKQPGQRGYRLLSPRLQGHQGPHRADERHRFFSVRHHFGFLTDQLLPKRLSENRSGRDGTSCGMAPRRYWISSEIVSGSICSKGFWNSAGCVRRERFKMLHVWAPLGKRMAWKPGVRSSTGPSDGERGHLGSRTRMGRHRHAGSLAKLCLQAQRRIFSLNPLRRLLRLIESHSRQPRRDIGQFSVLERKARMALPY